MSHDMRVLQLDEPILGFADQWPPKKHTNTPHPTYEYWYANLPTSADVCEIVYTSGRTRDMPAISVPGHVVIM